MGQDKHRALFGKPVVMSLLTTCLTFIIYFLTLAPDLTWANFGVDGGELITASYTLGVAHPPGYPTYVMLGKLFSLLPWHPIAYRYNLFSAVCMALAVGMVTLTAVHLTKHRPLASVTGLTFGLTSLVWGQATITEVYALNALCLSILLWILLIKNPYKNKFAKENVRFHESPNSRHSRNSRQIKFFPFSFFIGILQGLAITTHPTSLFFLPLTSWQADNKLRFSLGLLCGLTPFALLPFLGQSGQVWGDPTTLQGWWQLVSGQIYQANSFALTSQPYWTERVWQLVWQLTPVGTIAVLVGVILWRKRLMWGLAGTAVLYLSYALTYNTPDGLLFAIPALLIGALLMLPALEKVGLWSLALPLALFIINVEAQNLRHDTQLRDRALPFLAELPSNTTVMTQGDASIFAFWYFQQVEALRPDISIVDQNLLHFAWYRRNLNSWQVDDKICVVSLAEQHPTCHWRTEENATSGNQ